MARPVNRFVCQSCGAVTSKWSGRCESCGEWNTITQEAGPAPGPAGGLARGGPGRQKGRTLEFAGLVGTTPQPPRYKSGINEFDRVCGGGGWNYGNAQAPADQREKEVSLKNFRRNLTIDVFNEAGQKVISYMVFNAWVSEFTAQTDLDANANAILIQSIKIEHEGWVRDIEVAEPAEPTFTEPA